MKENRLRKMWSEDTATINGWLSMSNAFGAEVMASQGYDSLTVDLQHGLTDYSDALRILQALGSYSLTPMVRVPWLEPGIIMRVLDAGFYGVICPMINNRKQAEKLVSFSHYPPVGARSFGPTRALYAAGSDYHSRANEEILCLAMIETAEAMQNLQEIVSTPGLDGVYIGPSDLSLGLGNGQFPPGFDRQEPEMIDAIKRILETAHKADIVAGLHCGSIEYAAKAIKWGFNMTTVGSDARLLANGAKKDVSGLRRILIGEDEVDENRENNSTKNVGY